MVNELLQRPGTMSDGDFAWDFGPPRIAAEPNYKALLTELCESLDAFRDTASERGDDYVGSIYRWQDVMASLEDIAMQMAGVNP